MNTWTRTRINKWELEGTNYTIRKEIYNSMNVFKIYNFNTVVGMAGTLAGAKKVAKNLM